MRGLNTPRTVMIKEAEFKDHDVQRGYTIADNRYVSLIQYRMTKNEYESL